MLRNFERLIARVQERKKGWNEGKKRRRDSASLSARARSGIAWNVSRLLRRICARRSARDIRSGLREDLLFLISRRQPSERRRVSYVSWEGKWNVLARLSKRKISFKGRLVLRKNLILASCGYGRWRKKCKKVGWNSNLVLIFLFGNYCLFNINYMLY